MGASEASTSSVMGVPDAAAAGACAAAAGYPVGATSNTAAVNTNEQAGLAIIVVLGVWVEITALCGRRSEEQAGPWPILMRITTP